MTMTKEPAAKRQHLKTDEAWDVATKKPLMAPEPHPDILDLLGDADDFALCRATLTCLSS